MKKILLAGALAIAAIAVYAFMVPNANAAATTTATANDEITWLSWDEAIQQADKKPKKIFVDLYTDWCGWCKKMDATTFKDPAVVQYINEHFYAVKFDAEQKEEVQYRDHTFKFINAGRRGVHELAYSLLDGRLGYPSYVYLDENQDRITISPGFKAADNFIKELQWIGGGHYQQQTLDDFVKKAK
mgnify:CR=1 FL=1